MQFSLTNPGRKSPQALRVDMRAVGTALLAGALLAGAPAGAAQATTAPAQQEKTAAHKPAPPRKHLRAKTKLEKGRRETEKQVAIAPAAPATPPKPSWPVDEAPTPAAVTWDSHGLQVKASNSSLRQILEAVSTETGAKVEGLGTDQRVFGDYGPGPARDVLLQLLHGSGYNVLMLGDEGAGTPRVIVLSARNEGPATPNRANPTASAAEDEEEPQEQPVINRPLGVPMNQPPSLTPQQRFMEMEQREQRMLQEQNHPPQ